MESARPATPPEERPSAAVFQLRHQRLLVHPTTIFLPRIRFRLPYDVILITHVGRMLPLVAGRWLPERVSPLPR